jgi:hypothetical protein
VLAPLGLRLSAAKTRIVHMSEGFDFLGFRIQWRRKRGTNKWHVYTFIADRPIRSVKAKIRSLTNRKAQQHPGTVLTRLNQVMRGWTTAGSGVDQSSVVSSTNTSQRPETAGHPMTEFWNPTGRTSTPCCPTVSGSTPSCER